MVRLFTAGAEERDASLVWDIVDDPSGPTIVSTPTPRTGLGCYETEDYHGFTKLLSSNPTELYLGVAFYQSDWSDGRKLFYLGGPNIEIRMYSDGSLRVELPTEQVSSTGLVTIQQWYYLEIYIKPLNSGGVFTMKLDGSTIIDYTGDTTKSREYMESLIFKGMDEGRETYVDDIVANDATGSVNNSWPGQVHLLPIHAASDGDNNDFLRTGLDLGTNSAQVRPQATINSLVQSDAVNEYDLYTVDAPDLPAGAVIKNIHAMAEGRIETGSGSARMLCKQGSNTDEGSDRTLAASWCGIQATFPTNPADDAAWEEADLSGLQLGIKST